MNRNFDLIMQILCVLYVLWICALYPSRDPKKLEEQRIKFMAKQRAKAGSNQS